jgi:O-antigen ligase
VQRRLAVPTLALLVATVWLLLSAGWKIELQGSLIERAEALTPAKVLANRSDTYRLDERANVLEELRRHPVTGLGIGTPWKARHPLPLENEGGRQYTHIAILWWWLKLGILGPIAYLSLYGFGIAAAFRTAVSHPDRRLAAVGLGAAGALLGVLAAEATATHLGANARFTVLFGAVLGLLAVLRSQALAHERAQRAGVEPAEAEDERGIGDGRRGYEHTERRARFA